MALKFLPKNPPRRPEAERKLLEQQENERRKCTVVGPDLQLARSMKNEEVRKREVTKIICRFPTTVP